MVLILLMGLAAAEETSKPEMGDGAASSNEGTDDGQKKKWQVFFSAANIWPKLDESEGKIDKLINNGLGRLFPRWEEPETFKDWRDDFKLWDLQLGVGREINPHLAWYAIVGGVRGYQPNSGRYLLLGVPVKVNANFERTVFCAGVGLDYYPWGQPTLSESSAGENPIWRRLREAKPYFEAATGYVDVKGRASASIERPLLGKIIRYTDKARYDLFYVSPRVGIDIPLSKRNSISFSAGPLKFTSHQREFDNLSFYTTLRHRF